MRQLSKPVEELICSQASPGHDPGQAFPRVRSYREVSFRRRSSLSRIISLISTVGRISNNAHTSGPDGATKADWHDSCPAPQAHQCRRAAPWFPLRDRRSSRLSRFSNTGSTWFQEAAEPLRRQSVRWRANSRRTQSIRRTLRFARPRSWPRVLPARSIPDTCISWSSPPSSLLGGSQRCGGRRFFCHCFK